MERCQVTRESVRLYAERFPDRAHLSLSVFSNLIKTFQETGNIGNKKCNRVKTATDDGTATILAAIAENSYCFVRYYSWSCVMLNDFYL